MIYKIEFEAQEIATTNQDEPGRTFTAYKAFTKDGKKITLKFTRSCTPSPPTKPGMYEALVDDADFNIDNTRRFTTMWVKRMVEFKSIERKQRDYNDYFHKAEV